MTTGVVPMLGSLNTPPGNTLVKTTGFRPLIDGGVVPRLVKVPPPGALVKLSTTILSALKLLLMTAWRTGLPPSALNATLPLLKLGSSLNEVKSPAPDGYGVLVSAIFPKVQLSWAAAVDTPHSTAHTATT